MPCLMSVLCKGVLSHPLPSVGGSFQFPSRGAERKGRREGNTAGGLAANFSTYSRRQSVFEDHKWRSQFSAIQE